MGGAGIGSGAYTIIAFAVPPAQRAAFTGILGATYGVASVIGPLLGGVFTSKASWRWWYGYRLADFVFNILTLYQLLRQSPRRRRFRTRHSPFLPNASRVETGQSKLAGETPSNGSTRHFHHHGGHYLLSACPSMGRCDEAVELWLRHWHPCSILFASDHLWNG